MESYLFWKTAHVISAAILFGTGLGIAFFAWLGYRYALKSGTIEGLRTVLRLTVIADASFTAPTVIFQIISGQVLMHLDSWSLWSPWAVSVLVLFVTVGLLWLPVVWIQIVMSHEADKTGSIAELSPGFHKRFKVWFVLGVPAFLLVLAIFYLMVAKPFATS